MLSAIKADLMHLILTRKVKGYITQILGQILYIFEPEDDVSLMQVKEEINNVKKYLPKLQINR
jgi:hypothetical protein